jgi:Ala-tRNA(Pro) deacylase
MTVLPASSQVDFSFLGAVAGAKSAELASEREFKNRFSDCETGAMPPFGNLYDMSVFADKSLSRSKEIAFKAGSHRELVRLAWEDFQRLVKPRVTEFAAGIIRPGVNGLRAAQICGCF